MEERKEEKYKIKSEGGFSWSNELAWIEDLGGRGAGKKGAGRLHKHEQ